MCVNFWCVCVILCVCVCVCVWLLLCGDNENDKLNEVPAKVPWKSTVGTPFEDSIQVLRGKVSVKGSFPIGWKSIRWRWFHLWVIFVSL